MKYVCLAALLGLISPFAEAQDTISFFNWEGTDPLEADVGPNAISVGTGVFTGPRADGDGNGLGAPDELDGKANIALTLADDSRYDVAGLDLAITYRREESAYTMFERGDFAFGASGFNVSYRVTETDGSCSTLISSATFPVPDDNSYHRYRFYYDAAVGVSRLMADDTLTWSSSQVGRVTPNQPLCWTGAGNIVVGKEMDGSGRADVILDSLLLREVTYMAPDEATILYFNWEQGDPLIAAVGPNAVSAGPGVVTKDRIDGASQGLAAPVTPVVDDEQNIDLVIADDPIFNVAGMDLSVDFQANEGVFTLVSRNNFLFGQDGFNVTYRVTESDGSCSAPIVSTNTIPPTDDTYRNYRFRYDPNSGVALLSVNGATTWTNDGVTTPGQPMCWTGDGTITVGDGVDGNDTGNATLDNLRLDGIALNATLPVTLANFSAFRQQDRVHLHWRTATESGNDYFGVERSATGHDWQLLGRYPGHGTTNEPQEYTAIDPTPFTGMNYYRLRQVDLDGSTTYGKVVAVDMGTTAEKVLRVFPNPTEGLVTVADPTGFGAAPLLRDVRGRMLTVPTVTTAAGSQLDLRQLPAGSYLLQLGLRRQLIIKR